MSAAMHLRDVKNKASRKARAERREELARAKRVTAASLEHFRRVVAAERGEVFLVRQ